MMVMSTWVQSSVVDGAGDKVLDHFPESEAAALLVIGDHHYVVFRIQGGDFSVEDSLYQFCSFDWLRADPGSLFSVTTDDRVFNPG